MSGYLPRSAVRFGTICNCWHGPRTAFLQHTMQTAGAHGSAETFERPMMRESARGLWVVMTTKGCHFHWLPSTDFGNFRPLNINCARTARASRVYNGDRQKDINHNAPRSKLTRCGTIKWWEWWRGNVERQGYTLLESMKKTNTKTNVNLNNEKIKPKVNTNGYCVKKKGTTFII